MNVKRYVWYFKTICDLENLAKEGPNFIFGWGKMTLTRLCWGQRSSKSL